MFLTLSNGRYDPSDESVSQGFDGPTFEADSIRGGSERLQLLIDGQVVTFFYFDSMVFYDGSWWADWLISERFGGVIRPFEAKRARP